MSITENNAHIWWRDVGGGEAPGAPKALFWFDFDTEADDAGSGICYKARLNSMNSSVSAS